MRLTAKWASFIWIIVIAHGTFERMIKFRNAFHNVLIESSSLRYICDPHWELYCARACMQIILKVESNLHDRLLHMHTNLIYILTTTMRHFVICRNTQTQPNSELKKLTKESIDFYWIAQKSQRKGQGSNRQNACIFPRSCCAVRLQSYNQHRERV